MPKINKFIIQYKEIFKDVKIDISGKKPPKYLIKRFVEIVKTDITDPRYENMCTYPIETILVTAFIAILCNASNWAEISDATLEYKDWLCKFVEIPNGKVPIDDTYRRVFSLIDTDELIEATKKYLLEIFRKIKRFMDKYLKQHDIDTGELITKKGYTLINIDGKVARGTGRYYDPEEKKISNLQTLNVYNASDGISLFSIPIDNKENEIPVAQEVISKMNLKDSIVTMDALHAQHKTFDIIIKKQGDFLIGLKSNQGDAFCEVNTIVTPEYLKSLDKKETHITEVDKNGEVIKEYYKANFSDFAIFKDTTNDGITKWTGCRNIVIYKHLNKKDSTYVTQYFVTSLNDLECIVEAINSRWDVENLLHRYLDVSFSEDLNKTMNVNAFNNFSIMNKLCLSLLKLAKPIIGRSMIRMRKSFSMAPVSYLFSILAILDINVIEKAFNDIKTA